MEIKNKEDIKKYILENVRRMYNSKYHGVLISVEILEPIIYGIRKDLKELVSVVFKELIDGKILKVVSDNEFGKYFGLVGNRYPIKCRDLIRFVKVRKELGIKKSRDIGDII